MIGLHMERFFSQNSKPLQQYKTTVLKAVHQLPSKLTYRTASLLGVALLFYLLFMWHAPFLGFQDEYDNILGGWLISHHGQVPYRDFFSHHMPLTYFVSAAITLVTGTHLVAFRLIFVSLLFLWLLWIMSKLRQSLGTSAAVLFGLAVAISQYTFLSHLILAETLIAYACVSGFALIVLDLNRSQRQVVFKDVILISLIGCVPALCSASYLGISILIYVSFAICYARDALRHKTVSSRRIIRDLAVVSVPYVALLSYMLITHSLRQFIDEAYRFNTLYYSQFTSSAGTNVGAAMLDGLKSVIQGFGGALHISQPVATPLLTVALLCVIGLPIVLVVERRYFAAAWAFVAFYTSSVRGSILVDPTKNGTFRMMIYGLWVCLAASYLVAYFLRSRSQIKNPKSAQKYIALFCGALGITMLTLFAIQGLQTNFKISTASRSINTSIQLNPGGGPIANVINGVSSSNDSYWIGPWDFYTQLYVHQKRATKYTFFLPWHSVCHSCKVELLTQLATNNPRVIYWQHHLDMIGNDVDTFNPELLRYFNADFVEFQDPALQGYYFRKSDIAQTESRLRQLGYTKLQPVTD